MASSARTACAAPWRAEFLSHVSQMDSPLCVLSTIRACSPPVPRARTVVFRGMWCTLTPNPRNPAPQNPPVFESDHLTLTTDARMDKAREIAPSLKGGDVPGTDGGGCFEAVFWAPKVMTQWRFRGKAYLLGPDVESEDSHAVNVRRALLRGMRRVGEGDFSWEREVTAHFGNLSPLMRGSFRNPSPGRPIADGTGEEGLGLGQRVEDLHDEIARRNFRVVVLVPEEVDKVDLSDAEKGRRWQFRDIGGPEGSAWEGVEVWP
ncbi:hypothetical protein VUR80DRAFT_80 [Thermomyces stellatus]